MQKRRSINDKKESGTKALSQLAKTEKLFVSHLFRDTNNFSSLSVIERRSKIERAEASVFQFLRLEPRAAPKETIPIWESVQYH